MSNFILQLTLIFLCSCNDNPQLGVEYIPFIGQKRDAIFQHFAYTEDNIHYDERLLNWKLTEPVSFKGFDFDVWLYFTQEKQEPLEADEFYGFLYQRRVETPTDEDYKIVKKLAEDLSRQYGAPNTEEMLPNHLKDVENILDIRDGKIEGAVETWIVPLTKEAEERLDPERFYLEARLKIVRLDQWKEGAIEISLEYCMTPTQEEMARRQSAY